MRITNNMMTNSMLVRINNNMNQLDKYYTQMSSGKKIQMPSENPILASRALKLRNIVSSTEQYTSNSKQAASWMEITESAFKNITSIFESMGELCVQGASDQFKEDDRQKILNQFNSYVGQLESELNSTYMGRYVFSGYKTNTPPIIKDEFTGKNVLNPDAYEVNVDADKLLEAVNDNIVNKVNDLASQIADFNGKIKDIVGDPLDLESLTEQELATVNGYEADRVAVVKQLKPYLSSDTMEFVETTYEHDILLKTPDGTQQATLVDGDQVNSLVAQKNANNDGVEFFINGQKVDIKVPTEVFNKAVVPDEIKLEVGVNNYITINSVAYEVYPQEMYDELHYFEKVFDYMSGDLSQEDIDTYFDGTPYESLSESEVANFDKKIRSEFEAMISKVNNFNSSVTEQHTNLGVRMNRIGLIQDRLGDDNVNYTKLMSSNENINYAEAAMYFNVANASYNASLRVGMTITQLTLADFL